ncbi:carbon-nitrogen hydrolase family protein [Roseateles sp.]|jgi:predicted amidohydrolase|uniref:carbon-nitrogen hydrolase family protein n=1 Tax=Roseateles sp. TaxID=1971397 RepID=UPI00391BD96B
MKLAAIQMVSSPDVAHNLARARHWLEQAAAQGAQLAALPEYFCLMGLRDDAKLAIAEALGQGPIQEMLSTAARELGLWIIGGTLPLATPDPARVRNSCLVFAPDGSRVARYDKLHLFCFDNGRERYDEARVLEPGEAPVVAQAAGLRLGLSVCYDLRFPELYRAMGQAAPLDLISVPAAFTHTTGQAHWELLLRARAVENIAYLIAPAQGGLHENGRRTWGHSMIVDPWGEVLACLPEGEGLAIAELDLERLARVRQQLPALQHRRL